MFNNIEDNTFVIVAGDTFMATFEINDDLNREIDKVYFSCEELAIVKELENRNNSWYLQLNICDTSFLKPTATDYDITIKFIDGTIYTAIYRNKLIIKAKVNMVDCLW